MMVALKLANLPLESYIEIDFVKEKIDVNLMISTSREFLPLDL